MFYSVPICSRFEDKALLKTLYSSAFPKSERLPLWSMFLLARRENADFVAFYDDDIFCGFTYLVHYNSLTFILYLAICSDLRSKGYGSQIINEIKSLYPSNVITLNIEELNPNALNYHQRLRRSDFYIRNHFVDTGYILKDNGNSYYIYSCGDGFSPNLYKTLLKKFSFGFYKVNLVKR